MAPLTNCAGGSMHLTPNPPSQSHTTQSQPTTKPSQMPAPVMAWQSSLATSGVHGGSANTGTTMDETSGGQRALPSNYLSTPYSQSTGPACHSWFIVTTKDGKKGAARTLQPTLPSEEYMPSWCPLHVRSSRSTFPARKTQLMDRPVASIPPPHLYSHGFPYPKKSTTSSLTSMTPSATHSASNINFAHLPTLPTLQTSHPLNQSPHDNTKVNSAHRTKAVLPYPINLRPTPSELRPHCAAKDCLEKWLPHPKSCPFVDSPATLKLQERVKAVTLQGWAESTRTTYGAGLLVYHVFCDSREISEKERAPAKANLISAFISTLAGSLSSKAIHNYIYGV